MSCLEIAGVPAESLGPLIVVAHEDTKDPARNRRQRGDLSVPTMRNRFSAVLHRHLGDSEGHDIFFKGDATRLGYTPSICLTVVSSQFRTNEELKKLATELVTTALEWLGGVLVPEPEKETVRIQVTMHFSPEGRTFYHVYEMTVAELALC